MHKIYGLTGNGIVRYVGYTSHSLTRRLFEHVYESQHKNTCHRHRWIRSLLRKGVKPQIVLLEEVNAANWKDRERFWITHFSNLTNSTVGGEGLINPSIEVRQRIGAKVSLGLLGNSRRLGISHSDEVKARIGLAVANSQRYIDGMKFRRKPILTPELRLSYGNGNRGKTFSPETRAKMSASMTGKRHVRKLAA
jgi:hypothetical protein